MTTNRKQYTRQFKLDVLELARTSGQTNAGLQAELGLYGGQISAGRRVLSLTRLRSSLALARRPRLLPRWPNYAVRSRSCAKSVTY
jgi:transposase-like protein